MQKQLRSLVFHVRPDLTGGAGSLRSSDCFPSRLSDAACFECATASSLWFVFYWVSVEGGRLLSCGLYSFADVLDSYENCCLLPKQVAEDVTRVHGYIKFLHVASPG
jgi:hypothetical protein